MAKLKTNNPFLKTLAQKQILVPHLDNWFAKAEKFPEAIKFNIHMHKEKDDAFHPSSALGCARLLYAQRLGHTEESKIAAVQRNKTFLFGHFFHALLQTIIVDELQFCTWAEVEKEYDLGAQTKKGTSYRMRGFSDFSRVNIPGRDEPFLVDLKTMQARVFASKDLPYHLNDKYRAQVNLYLDWEDLESGIILCAEKDSPHRFKEIVVKRDPVLVNDIYELWDYVADCVAGEVVPDCTCEDTSCPMREVYG